ncbi:CYTH domain-containing protein [Candidatus Saccharibacteria bacterium]|nr:CYTH domain-containing protein [Candidatus Saccharibacteria bacterium]
MKKVVVKMKLNSREAFEKKLDEMGMEFAPVFWQHDRVFVPRNYRRGGGYPRLIMRTEMKAVDRPAKYSLILKRHIEDANVEVFDETKVFDYTEAANIIMQLGFKQEAEISRRRQEIKMGDGTTLYLDKVEGLTGYYAKIEAELGEKESAASLRSEIIKTFESLDQKNEVIQTYSELLL